MLKGLRLAVVVALLSFVNANADEGFSSAGTDVPANLLSTWNATVKIQKTASLQASNTSQSVSSGTGLIVDFDSATQTVTIITNSHVAGCPRGLKCLYNITAFSDKEEPLSLVGSEHVADFPELDLTVLKAKWKKWSLWSKLMDNKTKLPPPSVATLATAPGDLPLSLEVAAIGYPSLDDRSQTSWQTDRPVDYNKSIKRFSIGIITGKRSQFVYENYPYEKDPHNQNKATVTLQLPYVIKHNADTLKGNSGGPLVSTTGEVIGLVAGIVNASKNYDYCDHSSTGQQPACFYYAVPSDVILEKLGTL